MTAITEERIVCRPQALLWLSSKPHRSRDRSKEFLDRRRGGGRGQTTVQTFSFADRQDAKLPSPHAAALLARPHGRRYQPAPAPQLCSVRLRMRSGLEKRRLRDELRSAAAIVALKCRRHGILLQTPGRTVSISPPGLQRGVEALARRPHLRWRLHLFQPSGPEVPVEQHAIWQAGR